MPEMHLKQPGYSYSACGPFTENKERIQKFTETGDTSYIYKNELDKACFQHDMAYGDFKDLKRRTFSKYDGYQRGRAFMVYKFFDKKSACGSVNIPLEFNEQLAKELHNPIIRKFEKRKVILDLRIMFGELI